MTVNEAYERYYHLDELLSDPEFQPDKKDCDGCRLGRTLAGIGRDLWAAIKEQEEKAAEVL